MSRIHNFSDDKGDYQIMVDDNINCHKLEQLEKEHIAWIAAGKPVPVAFTPREQPFVAGQEVSDPLTDQIDPPGTVE